MGQKINPLSFRSNEAFTSQKSKWFLNINNFNYQILLYQDIEIKKLLINFFNKKNIYVHDILINRSQNNLIIDLLMYKEKSKIKKTTNKYKKLPLKDIKLYYKKFLLLILKKNLQLTKYVNISLNFRNINKKLSINKVPKKLTKKVFIKTKKTFKK